MQNGEVGESKTMQNGGFNGNLILPLLCSTSSGNSNDSRSHDSVDTISSPNLNGRSPLHKPRNKSVTGRRKAYNQSLDHTSSSSSSSRTCSSTAVNSRNVSRVSSVDENGISLPLTARKVSRQNSAKFCSIRVPSVDEYGISRPSTASNSRKESRKDSAVFHSIRVPSVDEYGISRPSNMSGKNSALRVPSVDEDGISDQGYPTCPVAFYPTCPVAFPQIRNLSSTSASRPHSPRSNAISRQGSILEIGCLRKVDDIRGRADERSLMQVHYLCLLGRVYVFYVGHVYIKPFSTVIF
jgi:hypothetical protein